MPDIFISYASEDRPTAKALADALTGRGFSVFWDRKIPVGRSFHEVIEQAIDQSRCVIVIWSQNGSASDWVRNEAEEGKRRNILQPVLIDDAKIPLGFRHLQGANLSDWNPAKPHGEFDGLIEAIRRNLANEPQKPGSEADRGDESPPPREEERDKPPAPTRQRKVVLGIVGAVAAIGVIAISATTCQKQEQAPDAAAAAADAATAPATESPPAAKPEAPAAVKAE